MSSLEEIRAARNKKRRLLESGRAAAYPARLPGNAKPVGKALASFQEYARTKKTLMVAGRIFALRVHGGSLFADCDDGTGRIQLYVKKDRVGDAEFTRFQNIVDIGDIIACGGALFLTKKKEKTLEVSSWTMLAKSIRPLPEKWHGLTDTEERFRKRYLDLLMNKPARERFEIRSRIVTALRRFFDREGFLEVETPIFHPVAGGALAEPFTTHHNALDADFFLRIAPELYLKQLIIGGMPRVYEMGKNFRNEGIDHRHNPEFTAVEWYGAYWDDEAMMANVERLFNFLFKTMKYKRTFVWNDINITFPKKLPRVTFQELLSRYALISDYRNMSRDSIALEARRLGIDVGNGEPKGKIAEAIYKKVCLPHVIQPVFVTHYPLDIAPLAKAHEAQDGTARQFQLVVGGFELVKAYAELNDPEEQRARFEEQRRNRQAGDMESHAFDESFIEALEYGMPPTAGAGLGVDRLVMLFTGATNIREVILFPTLRPKK